ncbi:uncharacterized protein L969DRAFT_43990 [Mixia osmundae IAM 14324]|uniref:uncharacterized protein n=1 Tax=Mixia osmundae (strain CBS 9802 / IAM 14324 / JCM 22182 / KY 12970) TaxID=764103 RepID=UPI0004A556E5|nr:uncharacterized protein L969DRAFT_43990 [Mixia osmundae IAM 14324]KEI42472.1 hypothetical protein L969DRAFT_43990 [Mixia osmundae IAM 14324]
MSRRTGSDDFTENSASKSDRTLFDSGLFPTFSSDKARELSDPSLEAKGGQSVLSTEEETAEWRVRNHRPSDTYEGLHRWDPKATWAPEEERRIRRRIDLRIMTMLCVITFALQLDRGTISNALSDNLLSDLGLTTADYNNGMTIFYCSFLFAELPSQLIGKKVGVDRWLPIQMVLWSIVAISQCRLTGKTSFYLTRAFLGITEGGTIPDSIVYASLFYTNGELPVRLSFYWVTQTLTQIVSAFIAYAILRLGRDGSWPGWRWLFLIEGLLTLSLGIIMWFYMPASPTQTRSFWSKHGWFSEREEVIMVNRILRDDPAKGDLSNREGVTLAHLQAAALDYLLWPIYLAGLLVFVAYKQTGAYLTLVLRSFGFSTLNTNLLTVPGLVFYLFNMVWLAIVARRTKQAAWTSQIATVWIIPLLIALIALPSSASYWIRYALIELIQSQPYVHPILIGLVSANSGTVQTRTVSAALYNMSVQAGSIIGSNIYQPSDEPLYRKGNAALLAITVFTGFLLIFISYLFPWLNRRRARQWAQSSEQEKLDILLGQRASNKRIDFRFTA